MSREEVRPSSSLLDVPKINAEESDVRNAFMLGQKKGETTIREHYRKQYLVKNRLDMVYESFRDLDNVLNLFFFSYSRLERSSFLCAKLWLGVMCVRTVMTNSITHLVDSPHLLSLDYEAIRMKQLKLVRSAKALIARVVQFVVIFKKNTEYWRFSRNTFLQMRVENLYEELNETFEKWKKMEIEVCSMDQVTKDAFLAHLGREKRRIKHSLLQVQPVSDIGRSDDHYLTVLDAMISDLRKKTKINQNVVLALKECPHEFSSKEKKVMKDDFLKVRIQMNIVRDVDHFQALAYEDGVEYEGQCQSLQEAQNFISTQFELNGKNDVLKNDDRIWPHQLGLEDLGPFGLKKLGEPWRYISMDGEKKEYTLIATTVDDIDPFVGHTGRFSEPSPIPYTTRNGIGPKMRKALKIPPQATDYAFFYPIAVPLANYGQDGFGALMKKCLEKIEDESPLHVLCYYGGFGYFDRKGELLQISGIVFGDDIFFDGPYFLPKNDGFQKIEECGHEMVNVTLQPLLDRHAKRFGWVSDFEDLKESFAEKGQNFGKYGQKNDNFKGAFFYQYDNSHHPEWDRDDNYLEGGRRNYFQVLDFQELSLKKTKNSNTPLLKRLEFEVEQHKAEWNVGYGITTKSEIGDNFSIIERNKKAKGKGCIIQ